MQHAQVGSSARSVNTHGTIIEHTAWRPSRLEDGRCCGRKPLRYKTERGALVKKDPHWFCTRCCREYADDGEQRPNFHYRFREDGLYHRDEPVGHAPCP